MSERNPLKMPALVVAGTLGFFGANQVMVSPGNGPTYISGPESANGEDTWIEVPARGSFSPEELLEGVLLLGAAGYLAYSVRDKKQK